MVNLDADRADKAAVVREILLAQDTADRRKKTAPDPDADNELARARRRILVGMGLLVDGER